MLAEIYGLDQVYYTIIKARKVTFQYKQQVKTFINLTSLLNSQSKFAFVD